MRFLAALLLVTASTFAQDGIDANIGTGEFPEGLLGVTDLAEVKKMRIAALEACVAARMARYDAGIESINGLLAAETELCVARVDATDNRSEQLKHIQTAFNNSLRLWQRTRELQAVGAKGGNAADEASARAQVFLFRVWWMKVKAGEDAGMITPSNPFVSFQ